MNNAIHYLNTDLELISLQDLTALAAHFQSRGVFTLHVTHGEDGRWSAWFETEQEHAEPESNIAEIVGLIESLDEPHRATWFGCTRRELNIGYDCGAEPWAFNQGLSSSLLGRIAAVGASLRLTLYPDREPAKANQPLPQPDESGPPPS